MRHGDQLTAVGAFVREQFRSSCGWISPFPTALCNWFCTGPVLWHYRCLDKDVMHGEERRKMARGTEQKFAHQTCWFS